MLKIGLTAGFQSMSWGCTHGYSTKLKSQVPCWPGIQTGCWFWDWGWRNKFPAPRYVCAHLRNLTYLNLPLLFITQNASHAKHPAHTPWRMYGTELTCTYPDKDLGVKIQVMWRGERRLWRIVNWIRHKKQRFWQDIKTQATHIAYNKVACFINIL